MIFTRVVSAAIAALVVLGFAAVSRANVYTFSGSSGDVFAFGVVPAGSSSFSATDDAYIPSPSCCNHGIDNGFTFSLAQAATVDLTVDPSLPVTEIELVQVNYATDNPNYNICCVIAQSNGGNNNPNPTEATGVDVSLAPGDYYFAVIVNLPAAAPDTAPYYSESYGGELVVTPSAAVPEPAAWATMLAGLVGVGVILRRRAKPAFAHA
jgi:hypothetical protein